MNSSYLVTTHGILSAVFWTVVGMGATVAVFSHRIKDTTWERIGLSGVALMSFATACRVVRAGFVSEGGLLLSFFLAFYVCALVAKHLRPHPPTTPQDKTRPVELET